MAKFLFSIENQSPILRTPDALCNTMESALDLQKQVKEVLPDAETSIKEVSDEEGEKLLKSFNIATGRRTIRVA